MSSQICACNTITGMIQIRSIVNGITARIEPSRIPCFSASGRSEAGSYRLPALKQGKTKLRSFLVSDW